MKVMISRDERGRALIKTVDGLNLQDLSHASDDQIKAVTSLVWEIKGLFYALIKGKASDVLGNFNIGGGAKLSATLVADLTASIPRDVVIGAQQQWLPNLAAEMANRPVTSDRQSGWSAMTTESNLVGSASREEPSGGGKETRSAKELPPAMRAGVKDAETAAQPEGAAAEAGTAPTPDEGGGVIRGRWNLPSGTPRAIKARSKDAEKASEPEDADEKADTGTPSLPCLRMPPPRRTQMRQLKPPQAQIPRRPRPMAAGERPPPTNSLGQRGGPNRRSALPDAGRASRDQSR